VSRRKPPSSPPVCQNCASLRALARAVRDAEQRVEASDPKCQCHGYRTSVCRATTGRSSEQAAERRQAAEALGNARAELDKALAELASRCT
jgi:hypothetical protein